MSRHSEGPVLEAVRRYLTSLIERTRAERRTRLPPVKQMAAAAGVSHAAVSEAVAELKRNGIVLAAPRRGIELISGGDNGNVTPAVYRENHRWRQAAAQLRRDLADGHYGYRPLPSQKELMGRYRVSKGTMKKALHALADEQTLSPSGKTYRLAAPTHTPGGNTIVLFARGANSGELTIYTPRVPFQLQALEQTCLSRNVQLHIVPCSYRAGEALSFPGWERGSVSESFDPGKVLGFMVWQMGLSPGFTRDLVRKLQQLRKPTTLFSERQEDAVVPGLQAGGMVRRYATATDFQAGMTVARFLLSRGHRRVCCWWDREDLAWARERVAGIERGFADAGLDKAVERVAAFAAGEYEVSRQEVELLNDSRAGIVEVARKSGIVPRDPGWTEASTAQMYSVYWEWATSRLVQSMRRVLLDKRCTAWIGMNDRMAVECLRFLRTAHARPPRQVSLIGFDDSYEAAAQRLSSYNFNGAAAMNRMVDFLLWPNAPVVRAATGEPVEVQGFVHERATTGPARAPTPD
jgi:DNA-binding LacI/PurR family transcriptional regulator